MSPWAAPRISCSATCVKARCSLKPWSQANFFDERSDGLLTQPHHFCLCRAPVVKSLVPAAKSAQLRTVAQRLGSARKDGLHLEGLDLLRETLVLRSSCVASRSCKYIHGSKWQHPLGSAHWNNSFANGTFRRDDGLSAIGSWRKETVMKHQTLEELHAVAEVDAAYLAMTRNQRLEHWATLLARDPERCLGALPGTEYMKLDVRDKTQCLDSPLSIAYADPILRMQGLKNDTYGEARRFFELSDWQLHAIVCHCHVGATMKAGWVAVRVRAAIKEDGKLFSKFREAITHWPAIRLFARARE